MKHHYRQICFLIALVILGSLSHPPHVVAQESSSSKTDAPVFVQKATQRAIDRIKNAVVNVRPNLKWDKIPSYETLLEEEAGERLKKFVSTVKDEDLMSERHKRALRILLYRLDTKKMYENFKKKLTQVLSRGATRIRDALDFLQYLAPPETGYSGVLLKDGYVLTTRFAVSGDHVKSIDVYTAGNASFKASVNGSYSRFDIALLKIKDQSSIPDQARSIKLSSLGDSIQVGNWAVAVGRGPRPNEITASRGIISANRLLVGRSLQTDAFGNYSNSGGALVDINGRLIGVISGITLENVLMVGHNSGVTKAIRPGALKEILPDLKQGKEIQSSFLGVQRTGKSQSGTGVKIERVLEGCAAAKAGLQKGDKILSLGGAKIKKWRDLVNQIRRRLPGDEVQLKIRRNGSTKSLHLKLTTRKCTE